MTSHLAIPEGQHLAHLQLMREVNAAVELGLIVPCLADPPRWEADDVRTQRLAARACGECPALAECRRYVDAWPEPANVWAGTTPADRREEGH